MIKKYFWIGYLIGFLFTSSLVYLKVKKILNPTEFHSEKLLLNDLNGNSVNFSELNSKPLVLNYWATWCAPCIQEFSEFEKVKKRYNDKVNFVMVSDESIQKINFFAKNHNYTFLFLQSDQPFSEIGLNTRPTTFFYDNKGTLISQEIGTLEEKEIEKSILQILNKKE